MRISASISVTERRKPLDELSKDYRHRLSKKLADVADSIVLTAYQLAPKDTGYLSESIFYEGGLTGWENRHYDEASAKAACGAIAGANPSKHLEWVGADTEGVDDLHIVVGVGARHGLAVEYGTINTPAQPFLGPAVDRHRADFHRVASLISKETEEDSW